MAESQIHFDREYFEKCKVWQGSTAHPPPATGTRHEPRRAQRHRQEDVLQMRQGDRGVHVEQRSGSEQGVRRGVPLDQHHRRGAEHRVLHRRVPRAARDHVRTKLLYQNITLIAPQLSWVLAQRRR